MVSQALELALVGVASSPRILRYWAVLHRKTFGRRQPCEPRKDRLCRRTTSGIAMNLGSLPRNHHERNRKVQVTQSAVNEFNVDEPAVCTERSSRRVER